MIQTLRSFHALSFLSLALMACGVGCSSQSESDYQNFTEITEVNGASKKSEAAIESLDSEVVKPLQAPRPEVVAVSEEPSSGTNAAGELVPLKAAKPVRGQTTREIQDTIENLSTAAQGPREIKLLVKAASFRKEDDAFRVSYDDLDLLKVLNMEPVPDDAVSYFPDWLSALDGKRIRIRGFMFPPFRNTEISGFLLARDNQICCMGKNPKIYDLIVVQMRKGVTTDYILNRPFDVVGTFHIRPDVEDGEWFNLYEISDAVVIDN